MGKKVTKKTNTISFSKIMKAEPNGLMALTHITVGMGDDAVSYTITPSLTLTAHVSLVDFIATTVINYQEDEESGAKFKYSPEIREFAIAYGCASYYTNIDLPTNINDAWKFLKAYRIFDEIWEHSDCETVIDEADKKIRYVLDAYGKRSGLDSMAESFGEVIKKAGESLTAEDIVAALKEQENQEKQPNN